MTKLVYRLAWWPLVAGALIAAAPLRADVTGLPMTGHTIAADAALRELWIGHAFWVRNVVMATATRNPAAATAAEQEVVANAKQIAAAIEPFYGKPAADQLFSLLAGHYGAVKAYLQASLAGSKAKQTTAIDTMTANAEQIAKFLAGANPHLPYDTLRSLLMAHGAHHLQQIDQIKAKQYTEEAKTWMAMSGHLLGIADALTGGLAQQFPEKFGIAAR